MSAKAEKDAMITELQALRRVAEAARDVVDTIALNDAGPEAYRTMGVLRTALSALPAGEEPTPHAAKSFYYIRGLLRPTDPTPPAAREDVPRPGGGSRYTYAPPAASEGAYIYVSLDRGYRLDESLTPCGKRVNVESDPCGLPRGHGGPCIRRSCLASDVRAEQPPAASERVCAVCGGYAGQMVAFVTGCAWICGPKCEERYALPPAASEGECECPVEGHASSCPRGFLGRVARQLRAQPPAASEERHYCVACKDSGCTECAGQQVAPPAASDEERVRAWFGDDDPNWYARPESTELLALLTRVRAEATEAERAHENEACALLVDTLLGDGNHVSARIRQRPAKGDDRG